MLLTSACIGTTDPVDHQARSSAAASAATDDTSPTAASPQPDSTGPFTIAEATQVIHVYDEPSGGLPSHTLDPAEETSGRLTFLAVGDPEPGARRIQVYLPVRPNGTRGWVDPAAVSLTQHSFRIRIRLSEHRLIAADGDDVLLDTSIAVGSANTPTPGGVYFINELLRPPSPDGPYGTYAYGLSGFSTVLDDFKGGDGVIGIHGTNDPSTIGTDVSHGCIRLTNTDIELLVEDVGLPLGTPVEILP